MKKFLIWCLPLVFVVATFITTIVVVNNSKPKNIYATNLNFVHQQLTLFKDSYVTLTSNEYVVEPENCTEKVIFATTDSSILEINSQTGEVYAKNIGTCTLIAYVKSSATNSISKSIEIVVENRNEDSPNKIYDEEKTVNCNLSQGIIQITFEMDTTKDKLDITIEEGNNLVEIVDYEYNSITLILNATGTAKVIVDSPVKKLLIIISIS